MESENKLPTEIVFSSLGAIFGLPIFLKQRVTNHDELNALNFNLY
jgi:hypothetical protein